MQLMSEKKELFEGRDEVNADFPTDVKKAIPLGYQLNNPRQPIGFMTNHGNSQQELIGYAGDAHLLTIGPTGSGKSRCGAIPALLSHRGPMIVMDIKGELYNTTANFRRSLGQKVYAIDPWNVVKKKSDGFNPLDILRLDNIDKTDEVVNMVSLITGGQMSLEDPFWDNNAEGLLKALVAYVAFDASAENARISHLRELFTQNFDHSMAKMLDDGVIQSPIATEELAQYFQICSDRTRPCVYTTAKQHFVQFGSKSIKKAMDKSSFDIKDLIKGKPMTIYFVIPPHKLRSHKKVLRLWIGALLNLFTRRKKRPASSTLFLIDEVAQLGNMDAMLQAITLLRGYGLQVWTFWQDVSQIKSLYPKDWQSIFNNTDVIQMLNPSNLRMASEFSEVDGRLGADEILKMDSAEQALFIKAERQTKIVKKLDYLQDPIFKGLFKHNPLFSR